MGRWTLDYYGIRDERKPEFIPTQAIFHVKQYLSINLYNAFSTLFKNLNLAGKKKWEF